MTTDLGADSSEASPRPGHDPEDVGTDFGAGAASVGNAAMGQVAVDGLVHLLDLEPIEPTSSAAASRGPSGSASSAARSRARHSSRSAGPSTPIGAVHSLHSYFIRPGDPSVPIIYEVDRVRDGRSFSTRRVVAIQHGTPIFTLSASFQLDQPGLDHQDEMPDAPPPDSLPTLEQRYADAGPRWRRSSATRPVRSTCATSTTRRGSSAHTVRGEGPSRVWMRANGRLPDDPLLHVCVLTFASDMTLLDSVLVRHGVAPGLDPVNMASLDHAMWFQRPFRADEWFLYVVGLADGVGQPRPGQGALLLAGRPAPGQRGAGGHDPRRRLSRSPAGSMLPGSMLRQAFGPTCRSIIGTDARRAIEMLFGRLNLHSTPTRSRVEPAIARMSGDSLARK